jgi:glutaredoxin 3
MNNIIWTTNYCPFCDKAKDMMEAHGLEYETRLVGGDIWTKDNLLAYLPEARTYPQVILNGVHIGGCDDLEAHFSLQEMSLGL